MADPARSAAREHHLLSILAICLIGSVLYAGTLHSPFTFDDQQNIRDNPAIRLIHLDWESLYRAAFQSPLRRPVAYTSFALNHYFGHYEVQGYHLVNIAIHLLNGVLVYAFALATFRLWQVRRPTARPLRDDSIPWVCLLAALVFVAHPLQTQSVTYIVQRMNSLATLFYLLALLLYIRGRLSPAGWMRWAWWLGCGAAALTSLGSKEIAATLPFVILLYEWYFFADLSGAWLWRQRWKLLAAGVVLVAAIFVLRGPNPLSFSGYRLRSFTLEERLLTQPRVVVFYLSQLLYPAPSRLNLLHDFPVSASLLEPATTLGSLLVVAAALALAIGLARRQRVVSFCMLWFFGNLVIESTVIPLEMIFEHRLYLPMVGFALLVAFGVFGLTARRPQLRLALCLLLIGGLGSATVLRNRVWRDEVTLWSDVVAKSPGLPRAHNNLGVALHRHGRLDEAILAYTEALRILPWDPRAHGNLGVALRIEGRLDDAIHQYVEALRAFPGDARAHNNLGVALVPQGRRKEAILLYSEALRLDPDDAATHSNLAAALSDEGRIEEAIAHYRKALRLSPDDVAVQSNLGVALIARGQLEEAARHLAAALRTDPDNEGAHINLGNLRAAQGRQREAVAHYREALRVHPGSRLASTYLAWTLATSPDETLRDPRMAIRVAEAAAHRLEAPDVELLDALAAGYAAAGHFEEAVRHAELAIRIAATEDETRARGIRGRLALYRTGRSYVASPRQPPARSAPR